MYELFAAFSLGGVLTLIAVGLGHRVSTSSRTGRPLIPKRKPREPYQEPAYQHDPGPL